MRCAQVCMEGNQINDNKTFGIISWSENEEKKSKMEKISAINKLYDNLIADTTFKVFPEGEDALNFFVKTAIDDNVCTTAYT